SSRRVSSSCSMSLVAVAIEEIISKLERDSIGSRHQISLQFRVPSRPCQSEREESGFSSHFNVASRVEAFAALAIGAPVNLFHPSSYAQGRSTLQSALWPPAAAPDDSHRSGARGSTSRRSRG